MKSDRHVPLILGVASAAAAMFIIFKYDGWWTVAVGMVLLVFGIPSIRTGLFATSREIDELTGKAPVSEETTRRFQDRL